MTRMARPATAYQHGPRLASTSAVTYHCRASPDAHVADIQRRHRGRKDTMWRNAGRAVVIPLAAGALVGCASRLLTAHVALPGQAATPLTMTWTSGLFGEHGKMSALMPDGERFSGRYTVVSPGMSRSALDPAWTGGGAGPPYLHQDVREQGRRHAQGRPRHDDALPLQPRRRRDRHGRRRHRRVSDLEGREDLRPVLVVQQHIRAPRRLPVARSIAHSTASLSTLTDPRSDRQD